MASYLDRDDELPADAIPSPARRWAIGPHAEHAARPLGPGEEVLVVNESGEGRWLDVRGGPAREADAAGMARILAERDALLDLIVCPMSPDPATGRERWGAIHRASLDPGDTHITGGTFASLADALAHARRAAGLGPDAGASGGEPVIIEVCERSMDPGFCHASIAGAPGYWARGRTRAEAIGELVRTHPGRFGVRVEELEGRLPR